MNNTSKLKAIPKNYQRKGVNTIIKRFDCRALLADDMGLGKSLQAIMLMDRFPDDRVLIICPASLKFNWVNELRKFLPEETPYVCSGTRPLKHKVPNRIIICNYEILDSWKSYFLNQDIDMFVADESHYLKNYKAKRTKAALIISKECKKVLALTGTPIENNPADLFTQIKLIDPSIFPSWLLFIKRYNGAKKDTFGWKLHRATNVKELHLILKKNCMVRRMKKDVLKELPSTLRQVVPILIDNRKEYEDARENIISWLRKNTVLDIDRAKNAKAVIELDKLKYIAAKGKIISCCNWINGESDNQKLVVFCYHKDILESLAERIKNHVLVDSNVTGIDRQDLVDRFQTDSKIRVLLTTVRIGGTGLTLTAASTTVFVQQDWNASKHDQAEDRVNRIGQEAACIRAIYFIAVDTVEEKIIQLIDARRKQSLAIVDGKKVEGKELIYELLEDLMYTHKE